MQSNEKPPGKPAFLAALWATSKPGFAQAGWNRDSAARCVSTLLYFGVHGLLAPLHQLWK